MNKGQSLFEVVVALAISALIIVTLVSLTATSIRNTTFSKNKTLAARYAGEAIEWLRGQRDRDITTFVINIQTPIRCLSSLNWNSSATCATDEFISQTPFKREATFSSVSEGGKNVIEANVRVYWTDSQGEHEVRSVTSFADWRER